VATLGWSLASSVAAALLRFTTGSLFIRYITLIHNADSRGAILSSTGNGVAIFEVWNAFIMFGLCFMVVGDRERFDHIYTFSNEL
jgi:hypothetical protein